MQFSITCPYCGFESGSIETPLPAGPPQLGVTSYHCPDCGRPILYQDSIEDSMSSDSVSLVALLRSMLETPPEFTPNVTHEVLTWKMGGQKLTIVVHDQTGQPSEITLESVD